MNLGYISQEAALAISDALGPAGPVYRVGEQIRFALVNVVGVGRKFYVQGDTGVDITNTGLSEEEATKSIQNAVDKSAAGDTIVVIPRKPSAGASDPVSYAETVIIPATKPGLTIVGVNRGRTQGGLPQIKIGAGAVPMITIRAPGCLIAYIGINGAGSTGGGILLEDDAATKSAFGTTIASCHFKNCAGTDPLDAATGGAIMWGTNGGAWQTLIYGNRFFKNVGDIVLIGTGTSIPQDVIIEKNIFGGPAASVDCNIYLAGGSGMLGPIIIDNYFTALPAIGSAVNHVFMDLTGCVGGIVAHNKFADTTTATGYGAAKAKAKIPTTVFMIDNYNESGLITREA